MNSQESPKPYEQDFYPPVPTEFTVKSRTNLVYQLLRFAVLNIRMLKMVRKH